MSPPEAASTALALLSLFANVHCFNLYIGSDEMSRTLGISARMDYVTDGQLNEYSVRFPYRVAMNVSHLRFTWANTNARNLRYTVRATSEHFDVLPILHLPTEGIVPRKSQNFVVEYRCVGARSGQFQVHLQFNVSLRPPLQFTLRQEKICSSMEGRRMSNAEGDALSDLEAPSAFASLPLFVQFLVGLLLLLTAICVVLVCCCWRAKDQLKHPGEQEPRNGRSFRRGRFGSLYAADRLRSSIRAGRSSLRNKLHLYQQRQREAALASAISGGGAHTQPTTRTASSVATSSDRQSTSADSTRAQLLLHSTPQQPPSAASNEHNSIDPCALPSTSTAPFPTTNNSLQVPGTQLLMDRVVLERPEAQQLDINAALVELNADRNLFEQSPRPELDGTYGQLVWANWRQTGTETLVDEVDDEEDDAKEDKALICKTLKPGAGRTQFERFLQHALQFHHVPAHPHLAQVTAAATFGNFRNPESVKDLPLICYAHDGFGILKRFLRTCRAQAQPPAEQQQLAEATTTAEGQQHQAPEAGAGDPLLRTNHHSIKAGPVRIVVTATPSVAIQQTTLRTHDLVSMAAQLVGAVQHLQKFGVIHKDIAARNCLVSRVPIRYGPDRLHVQLCDSALSRDLFPDEYAPIPPQPGEEPDQSEEARPLRWMAPELLLRRAGAAAQPPPPPVFTSATDMWAFGVLLWELFTCAQLPYEELDAEEVVQAVASAGLRLSQPYNCPDEMYTAMCQCWMSAPEERPTAEEMDAQLAEFMQRLRKYI